MENDSRDFERLQDREEDVGDLGAWSLIGRCVKLYWTHGSLFHHLLVIFVFPIVFVASALPYRPTLIELGSFIEPEIQNLAGGNFTQFEVKPSVIVDFIYTRLFGSFFNNLFLYIAYVHVVYNIIRILLDSAWRGMYTCRETDRYRKRASYAMLWWFVFYSGVMIIGCLIMYAAYLLSSVILFVVVGLVEGILIACSWFIFQMSFVVVVVEDVHGWKALERSWKLLLGKKWVAFQILCLKLLLICVTTAMSRFTSQWILQIVDPRAWQHWPEALLLIVKVIPFVVGAAFGSITLMFMMGTETFLYFSCKAVHQESVKNLGFSQDEVAEGAYEQLSGQTESSEA